jgi:hypothetical protein
MPAENVLAMVDAALESVVTTDAGDDQKSQR